MPDLMKIKEIYDLYGKDPKNQSLINNNQHNLLYKSLPNKWINGIPYSGFTSQNSAAEQTTVQKSNNKVRINLLLANPVAGLYWKIPLLKNPA
jgi:hypothetical protein